MLNVLTFSSLHKIFPDEVPKYETCELSCLKNEPLSFQATFRLENEDANKHFYVKIETDLPISLYYVGNVPVLQGKNENFNYQKHGLYPDILIPKAVNPKIAEEGYYWQKVYFEKDETIHLSAMTDNWQILWLTVNEQQKSLKCGKHKITLNFYSRIDNSLLATKDFTVNIIDQKLPTQKLFYTTWFYSDCLMHMHNVEFLSDGYFELLKKYARIAVINGQNMLLVPAFTPPLDTPVNTERPTTQLVKIKADGDNYEFDFSDMKKYIDACKSVGIKYFEHSHLFTQWGAKSAPKIVAEINGKQKRIFGWDTKAYGAKYKNFLKQYLPAVIKFFEGEGLKGKVLFHISDEPTKDNYADYKKALDTVGNLLDGCMVGDALSDYTFYENGVVKTPIAVTASLESFKDKCDNLWCYYTGNESHDNLSNRLLTHTLERTRILGVQMYHYKVKGFLHWGYNYCYDTLSHGTLYPQINPGLTNPGSCYLVYPANNTVFQSIRQKVLFEAINDMRALKALERKLGRAFCDELINKHFGEMSVYNCPTSPEQLLNFRKELNEILSKGDVL